MNEILKHENIKHKEFNKYAKKQTDSLNEIYSLDRIARSITNEFI